MKSPTIVVNPYIVFGADIKREMKIRLKGLIKA
jgi:hypothetical protein